MSEQQTTAERFPHLAGSIDYDAFLAAINALSGAYDHLDEYRDTLEGDDDYFAIQRGIEDRLSDVPEPARTWLAHAAGIDLGD